MTTFEKDIEIITESAMIEIMRAEADFNKIYPVYMMESDEEEKPNVSKENDGKKESAFKQALEKIFNGVMNVIHNIINAIGSIFKSSDTVSAEEYFDNPNVQITMDENINQVADRVDDELRKGKGFLQLLSRGTHIPDNELEGFLNRGAEIVSGRGQGFIQTILTGVSAFATGKIMKKKISGYGQLSRDAYTLANSANPECREQAMKVYSSMGKLKAFFAKRVGKHYHKIEEKAAINEYNAKLAKDANKKATAEKKQKAKEKRENSRNSRNLVKQEQKKTKEMAKWVKANE